MRARIAIAVAVAVGGLLVTTAGQAALAVQWWIYPVVLAGAVLAGSFLGARLAGRIPEVALRKGFGIFVLVMGLFVLVQELPAPGGLIWALRPALQRSLQ